MVEENKHIERPTAGIWLKNLLRLLLFLGVLALLIFLPAGTLKYWQGWVFLIAFGCVLIGFIVYGMLYDPNMLKERSHKAKNVKGWDTILLNIYTVFLVAMVILAPLDGGRFHWSQVPLWINLLGLGLMIPALALLTWVTITNTYLSRYVRIQDDRGHQVVTLRTVPLRPSSHVRIQYSVLPRHPNAAGILVGSDPLRHHHGDIHVEDLPGG